MRIIAFFLIAATAATAEPPAELLEAGKDKSKKYYLIGDTAEAPKNGFGLVIVMPGGDGSAEFLDFVKSIQEEALPKGYLVAQPVAVKWHNAQAIVWPTAKDKDLSGLKFTTEEFVDAVITDVTANHKIDAATIFTLTWSSSGPAAYAVAMSNTRIAGSFIAMSVFKEEGLKLEAAKGKPFFLYQSPLDRVTSYHFAEKAKKTLEKHGAKVTLVDYDGGHGWNGATMDDIRTGIQWLQRNASKK